MMRERALVDEVLLWLRLRPRLLGEIEKIAVPRKKELIEKYKTGLATAIGVKPEEIREDLLERWLVGWLRAIIKPEAWEKYGLV